MKELKVGERIILEVVEATSFSCQDCFFAKEGYASQTTAMIAQMARM